MSISYNSLGKMREPPSRSRTRGTRLRENNCSRCWNTSSSSPRVRRHFRRSESVVCADLQLTTSSSYRRLSLCRHLSSGRHVSSRLQLVKSKYEQFLKRRFPRFYKLYHTFKEGCKMLFADVKEVTRIQGSLLTGKVTLQNMPYRDMEKLRQVRRDMIKAFPIVLISIPPFANYLVFVLISRWSSAASTTPSESRARGPCSGASRTSQAPGSQRAPLQSRLKKLCTNATADVSAVRELFSGPPLGVKWDDDGAQRHICPLLFLTPRLPGFLVGRRLNKHAQELLRLDRALVRLGIHQLSDSELKTGSESSLLLHSMVLLSANYPQRRSGR
ncbi:hypothetical protein CRUP_027657 [Coryphaenoides rupestris]|nr:hypothetical protein CRUP_027657 [Coryphaenoides rupestris]